MVSRVCHHCQGAGVLPGEQPVVEEYRGAKFTRTQGAIIAVLLAADGKPVSRDSLYTAVENCNGNDNTSPILRTHMIHIRRRLKAAGIRDVQVRHVRGKGYALDKMPGVMG